MNVSETVLIPCTIPGDIGSGTLTKKAVDFAKLLLRSDLGFILEGENLAVARADLESGVNLLYQVHGSANGKIVLGPITNSYETALEQARQIADIGIREDHPVTVYFRVPRSYKPVSWAEVHSSDPSMPPVIVDRVSHERHYEQTQVD